MEYLTQFDKATIWAFLSAHFTMATVQLYTSKSENKNLLMFSVSLKTTEPNFTMLAPLGTMFTGFQKTSDNYNTMLVVTDLEALVDHYNLKIKLHDENLPRG
jgi:hypothetical protein